MSTPSTPASEFWIFGYGSLIWKPPPHFDLKVPGYIFGYVRRFWQASEDHRGTPSAPGRVVTLIERGAWEKLNDHHDADNVVWGVAYRIPAEHVEKVKSYLDIREINGYSIHYVDVHQAEAKKGSVKAMVYIGTPENPQFIAREGAPSEEELAEKIHASRGPSGENKEYLFELHQSLMELCPEEEDAHVKGLFRRVAIMEAEDRINGIESKGVGEPMECHAKPDAQEETEPEMTDDVVMG